MALMFFNALERAACARGLQLQSVPVRAPAEYNSAFAAMTAGSAQALLILSNPDVYGGCRVASGTARKIHKADAKLPRILRLMNSSSTRRYKRFDDFLSMKTPTGGRVSRR